MKTIKCMIAAAVIGTALFTGCNKDNSMEETGTGTTANETINNGNTTTITYRLQTIPLRQGSLILWDKGYINAAKDFFNGSHMDGNMVQLDKFQGKGSQTVDLLDNPLLGTVSVPFNMYLGLSLSTQLNAVNGENALFLSGVTNIRNGFSEVITETPVQVIVDEPVLLSSQQMNNVAVRQPADVATMVLDMNLLINGIDPPMLQKAEITNGVIIISRNSNPNLYGLILTNLQQNLLPVQISPQAVPVNQQPGPQIAAPATASLKINTGALQQGPQSTASASLK